MATALEDAELLLIKIEKGIQDLKLKFDSKQSERLISNHVWMADYIENSIKRHTNPLKDLLMKLKGSSMGDFKSSTNFDVAVKYCTEIEKTIDGILFLYKTRAGIIDLKLKWQYNLPAITESFNHLKNRFMIIKGQITRKRFEYEEEENWF